MGKNLLCTTCLHQGPAVKVTRGSFVVEVALWLCFLLPGLIYGLWRLTTRHEACASCGSSVLIPLDSPRAAQLLRPPV